MSARQRKYQKGLMVSLSIIFSILIPTLSFAQEFTAKTIGDYGNVTVMEVTGNLFSGGANRQMNQYLRYSSLAVFRIILSILIIVWN